MDASGSILTAQDAERLVEGLTPLPLTSIGTRQWLLQHKALQQLNIQAHSNAQRNADPFVMEAVLTFNKLPVLLHELLVSEAWSWRVCPLIKSRIAGRNAMRAYFAAYQEAVIVNMLEVFLYHDYAAEALGDAIVDLVDFCMRKVSFMIRLSVKGGLSDEEFMADAHGGDVGAAAAAAGDALPASASASDKAAAMAKATAAASAGMSAAPQGGAVGSLEAQYRKIAFGVGVAALGVLRFISEHIPKLPLSAYTRVLDTHDVPLAMVPLIENPPWTKRAPNGKWYKYANQAWAEVPVRELLKLTPTEGQPWLVLYNLLCDKEGRAKYTMHGYRRGAVMRVRKYMHDVLMDQLPPLSGLQRYLDELQVTDAGGVAAPGSGASANKDMPSMFVLEVQPDIHDSVVRTALASGEEHKEAAQKAGLLKGAEKGGDQTSEGAGAAASAAEEDADPRWAGVAAAILENGFAASDAGDASLMSIADIYSSALFEEVMHTQAEATLLGGGSSSDEGGDSDDEETDSDDEPEGATAPKVQVLG